ncbi:DUF3956 family protein [Nonomuraea typhae]|uniref:DUF3956 family protein n=1 Tax=Nonomuraea typhae TaxID=2603600 RepID=A0ABW7Z968_9ACTN
MRTVRDRVLALLGALALTAALVPAAALPASAAVSAIQQEDSCVMFADGQWYLVILVGGREAGRIPISTDTAQGLLGSGVPMCG